MGKNSFVVKISDTEENNMKQTFHPERITRAAVVTLTAMVLLGAVIPAKAAPISPGLNVIATEYTMAKSGLVGTHIKFSREDFQSSLGVDSVGKITITSLPDLSKGHLQLGNKYVEVGQVISEKNLDSLKYVPYNNKEAEAVFSFTRGSGKLGTPYECKIYTLDSPNASPVIALSDCIEVNASGEIGVYSGVTHLGTIPAYDADDDSMTFEIIRLPAHGSVKLTDRTRGYYEYTSEDGYVGLDSFTVCVTDKYGNRSPETKIMLRTSAPKDGEVFADMDGHWANSAVITCVRANVLEAAGENEYFYPSEPVSRAEFLSYAMSAAGYTGFEVADTGFADDAQIPEEYKGCIAAANALGIINGVDSDGELKFYPNNQITRAEAAVIVSRLTGIENSGSISVFADGSVPAWARGAFEGLLEVGILRGNGSSMDPYSPLTRAAAIKLASSIVDIR